MHFTATGIKIISPTKVHVDTPEVEITGNVLIGGKLIVEETVEGKKGGTVADVVSEKHTNNCRCGESDKPNK